MANKFELVFSPIHAKQFSEEELREQMVQRFSGLMGIALISRFDDNGRFIIYPEEVRNGHGLECQT